jgi:methylated-DNA-[protein]-cysteine S-methyltransferase
MGARLAGRVAKGSRGSRRPRLDATYGDIASLAGRPLAYRAIGNIMRECPDTTTPCHRVVAAGGAIGGYGGLFEIKRRRLRAEGIDVGWFRLCHFSEMRWQGRG